MKLVSPGLVLATLCKLEEQISHNSLQAYKAKWQTNNGAVGLLKFVSKVGCHKFQQNFHHVTVAKVMYLLGF